VDDLQTRKDSCACLDFFFFYSLLAQLHITHHSNCPTSHNNPISSTAKLRLTTIQIHVISFANSQTYEVIR
jgi:hypothetical protein